MHSLNSLYFFVENKLCIKLVNEYSVEQQAGQIPRAEYG